MKLKNQIITLVSLFLLTVLSFSLLLYFSNSATSKFANVTQANYNLRSDDNPVTIGDFEELSERMSLDSVSFAYEAEEISVKDTIITPVYTTHNLFELYGIKLDGEVFSQDDVISVKKEVVISDTLALKLYFTTDVVGKEFVIHDEIFTVCAVYNDSENLIDKLSKDGKERVFIPYTCANTTTHLPIHTIVYDNDSFSAPLIEQMNLPQYHFTNMNEKAKVVDTFIHIVYLVLYIGFCVVAMLIWFYLCKQIILDIRENLIINYFLKSLLSVPIKYFLLIVVGLGVPAVLLFVFLKSDFSIYIISKYIPYDNLFDIQHYINCIIYNSHNMNNISLIGDTYLINLYESTFNVIIWLMIMFIMLFGFLLVHIVSLIQATKSRL